MFWIYTFISYTYSWSCNSSTHVVLLFFHKWSKKCSHSWSSTTSKWNPFIFQFLGSWIYIYNIYYIINSMLEYCNPIFFDFSLPSLHQVKVAWDFAWDLSRVEEYILKKLTHKFGVIFIGLFLLRSSIDIILLFPLLSLWLKMFNFYRESHLECRFSGLNIHIKILFYSS